jgi:hypothetical protein
MQFVSNASTATQAIVDGFSKKMIMHKVPRG